jgi:outer membrane protein assembly factor BamB
VARWSADSLACAYCDATTGIGAPTLLADGALVVACGAGAGGGGEVCEVDGADGSLVWRNDPGGRVFGAPAVDTDGTIYVTVLPPGGGTDLVALWGATPAMAGIWPTEGGGMGRLRRR